MVPAVYSQLEHWAAKMSGDTSNMAKRACAVKGVGRADCSILKPSNVSVKGMSRQSCCHCLGVKVLSPDIFAGQ